MAPNKRKQLGDFFIGKTIGQGAFSKVKLGFHKDTGLKVAIKVIDKKLLAEKVEKAKKGGSKKKKEEKEPSVKIPSYLSHLQLEVQLLMRLDHPNVIKLYQMLENDDECYIIMEYATGGELINYIANKGHLSEKEARKYFRQMISALDHCHRANVVHRDLKLENLLLDSNRDLLISDFGLGRTFKEDELLKTFCGTPNYAAAELVSGIPYLGVKSDIWAMGVVLYIMMTGNPPFRGDTISSLYGKIKTVDYHCPAHFSEELTVLLSKILVKDPNARADMESIRNDPWVNYEEDALPPRIEPKVQGDIDPDAIARVVSGITMSDGFKVYTFRALVETKNSVKVGESTLNAVKRLSNSPLAEKTPASQQPPVGPRSRRLSAPVVPLSVSTLVQTPSTGPISPVADITFGPQARRYSKSNTNSINFPTPQSQGSSRGSRTPEFGSTTPPSFESRNRRRSVSAQKSPQKGYTSPNDFRIVGTPSQSESLERPRMRARSMSVQYGAPLVKKPSIGDPKGLEPLTTQKHSKMLGSSGSATKSLDDPDPFYSTYQSPNSETAQDDVLEESPSGDQGLLPIVSEDEIIEWHNIHKPPKEIRTIRWNFSSATTSNLPPSVVFQHVHKALDDLNEQRYGHLKYTRVHEYYMMHCVYDIPNQNEQVCFEVEVCRVWLLKVHGVKVKRIKGDPLVFKELYTDFVKLLHI